MKPTQQLHDLGQSLWLDNITRGGELEQIQFLLGCASVQKTKRYLDCEQKLDHAVNGNL